MTDHGETPQEALARLKKDKATGTLTIHIASGRPRRCEFLSMWHVPPENGRAEVMTDLTETKSRR